MLNTIIEIIFIVGLVAFVAGCAIAMLDMSPSRVPPPLTRRPRLDAIELPLKSTVLSPYSLLNTAERAVVNIRAMEEAKPTTREAVEAWVLAAGAGGTMGESAARYHPDCEVWYEREAQDEPLQNQ